MTVRFRLIDVMVAVAAVTLLALLLLPALNTGTGYTRTAHCQNHLRNIALACLLYQTQNGPFPPSVISGEGRGVGQTCFTAMLPYVDYQLAYNSYNFQIEPWHPDNAEAVASPVAIYRCPDGLNQDPLPARDVLRLGGVGLPGNSRFTPGHYAVDWGGGRAGWGSDFERTRGRDRGVMRENWGARPADLVDGAGTTLMVGEKVRGQGWAVGGWAGSEFDVGVSPSYRGDDPAAQMVYTGSGHPRKTNFAFCDGSVRGLTAKTARKVWYDLITRDGREAVDPDTIR